MSHPHPNDIIITIILYYFLLEENCPYFLSMMQSADTYYLENQVPVLPANIESIIGWLNFFYLLGDI